MKDPNERKASAESVSGDHLTEMMRKMNMDDSNNDGDSLNKKSNTKFSYNILNEEPSEKDVKSVHNESKECEITVKENEKEVKDAETTIDEIDVKLNNITLNEYAVEIISNKATKQTMEKTSSSEKTLIDKGISKKETLYKNSTTKEEEETSKIQNEISSQANITKNETELKPGDSNQLCSRSPMKPSTHHRSFPYVKTNSYSHCSGGITMYCVSEKPEQLPPEYWRKKVSLSENQNSFNIPYIENETNQCPVVSSSCCGTYEPHIENEIKHLQQDSVEDTSLNIYIKGFDDYNNISLENIDVEPFREEFALKSTKRTHYNSVCSSDESSLSPLSSVLSPFDTISTTASDSSPIGSPQTYGNVQSSSEWRDNPSVRSDNASSPFSSSSSPQSAFSQGHSPTYVSDTDCNEILANEILLQLELSSNPLPAAHVQTENVSCQKEFKQIVKTDAQPCVPNVQNCSYGASSFPTVPSIVVLPPELAPKPTMRPKLILPKGPITTLTSEPAKVRLMRKLNRVVKSEACKRITNLPAETFTEGDEKDGDTQLMIWVSRPRNGLLEFLYAMVERMKQIPGSLAILNKQGQSALYVACRQLPNEPLAAAYIAETLIELGEDLRKMTFENGLPLTHCISRWGDSHVEILNELMNLKDKNLQPIFTQNNTCDINGNL